MTTVLDKEDVVSDNNEVKEDVVSDNNEVKEDVVANDDENAEQVFLYKYCDPVRLDGARPGCGKRIRVRPRATKAEDALEEDALDQNGFHYCPQTVSFVYTDRRKTITTQGAKIPIILPSERKPSPCIYCVRCDMIHSALARCIEDSVF